MAKITNEQLSDISQNEIKGRSTAGSGATEDLTAAQVRTILNVEDGATADQTGAEIKTAYEAEADTNAFTDADHSKLDGIESNATADQTDLEIKTAYENNANTNAFTDAEQTKLSGIETGADVTDSTNVNAAGATMNTDSTLVGNSYFLDEDDMSSNDATKVASQQSIKAYVDDGTVTFTNKTIDEGNNNILGEEYQHFTLPSPSAGDKVFINYPFYAGDVKEIRAEADSGTGTLTGKINGTLMNYGTGTNIALSSTQVTANPTAATDGFLASHEIEFEVTVSTSLVNLRVSVKLKRTS